MSVLHIPRQQALTHYDHLPTLIENRSVFTLNQCELNVFETHQQSSNVRLQFSDLTFTAMLRGKKHMGLFGSKKFEYLPGESVIVPGNEEMVIDFPEADEDNPTQCIALVIDKTKVQETVDLLNESYAKAEDGDRWQLRHEEFHLTNSLPLVKTVNRLVEITQEQVVAKDVLADFALRELLIRLMQTQARNLILENYTVYANTHRFSAVVEYIKQHLTEAISIEELSNKAYMSQSHFFRSFKMEFGISPLEYIIHERIKQAKYHLANPGLNITDVCFKVGFNSITYFSTMFKKYEGISPKQYQQRQFAVHRRQSMPMMVSA